MFGLRPSSRLTAGDVVEVHGWPVRLAVSARARRVSLRIDPSRREAVAVAPTQRRLPDALAFAHSRGSWLAERLARLPTPFAFRPGAGVDIGEVRYVLERAARRVAPRLIPAGAGGRARLVAAGDGEAYARAVMRALRAEALARLGARTAAHCARLGEATPPCVRLQDARGRWGSCRQAGAGSPAMIRYNWRLVMAPSDVLDYVAAHECAHLREANHGPRFWALVADLHGDPARSRAWLRTHGAALHAAGGAT